jgi:GNAT superfamily N-acetyltransferase
MGDLPDLVEPLDAAEIARLDEARQSHGVSRVADVAEPLAGGFLCFAGPGSWANQAFGLGMIRPVDDAAIDRIVDFYASRGVEPRIELCPHAHDSLVHGLARRGFVVREFKNVLARDLRVPLPDPPDGVEVARVNPVEPADLAHLTAIRCAGFGDANVELAARLDRRSLALAHVHGYLASVDGQRAAAGMCDIDAGRGISGLFGAATLAPHRRRGCQRALMIARLRAAKDAGCRWASVHSVPHIGTARNALRLGFQILYTKVTLVRPAPGLLPSR